MAIKMSPILPTHLEGAVPMGGFHGTTVLILGDLMLDRYILGDVTRISPEAPVPVLSVSQERMTAGGAGNVALNVAGLGARAIVAGVVGGDITGQTLQGVLAGEHVDLSGVVVANDRPTTSKTRVMSGGHQIVRVDHETTQDISTEIEARLLDTTLNLLAGDVNGVILSDYAKGVLTPSIIRQVIDFSLSRNIPVFVDPKRVDYSTYARATCLTPNLKEFRLATSAMGIKDESLASSGSTLREKLDSPLLLITQGAEGMTLISADHVRHFPALAEDVFDVSGAGDTVVSTYAVAFAAGLHPILAVEVSNFAASVVVRKVGTAPISWTELQSAGASPKALESSSQLLRPVSVPPA